MESVIRDVKNLGLQERQIYELAIGHSLDENQRVLLTVLNPGALPDESTSRRAIEEFAALCREGTENRQRQGITVEEADQAVSEAVQAARSGAM